MPLEPMTPPAEPMPPASARREYRWYHKALALALVIFCLEVGIILLILPWSEWWEGNYFSSVAPAWPLWKELWNNNYLRGAVSGLGIVNIYISFGELLRLRRFAE
jgi:hypothetical protein